MSEEDFRLDKDFKLHDTVYYCGNVAPKGLYKIYGMNFRTNSFSLNRNENNPELRINTIKKYIMTLEEYRDHYIKDILNG
jgi:hypothetical protein